jgi:hypothetical protein
MDHSLKLIPNLRHLVIPTILFTSIKSIDKLLTMDDSALVSRKDAANRDKQYDLHLT